MKAVRDLRERCGLSQRELAARAEVSFKGLQLLEQPGHNWRVMTLNRVAGALGMPVGGVEMAVDRLLRLQEDSIAGLSLRVCVHGFASWKTHLFDFVDSFRSTGSPSLVCEAPVNEADPRLRALFASTTEALCSETSATIPAWCAGIPALDTPWFVAGIENLKAAALVESPAWFRQRNIYVLGNFLSRA